MDEGDAEGRGRGRSARRRAMIAGWRTLARAGLAPESLIEGPVAATLALFSLPLLTTNFLNSLSGTWSAIWVSHVLGPNALTAVANANVFMGMMTGAVMGVGSASGIVIGQLRGAGDLAAVRRVVGTSVSFVVAASLIIGALGFAFTPALLDIMHLPTPARAPAIVYMRCTCLAMPFIFTFMFVMMMVRGSGDARTPFRFALLGIGLGLFLGPALLTGAFGFPRLGMAGLAIGGLLANAITLAALVVFIYVKRLPLALRGADLRHLKPDPALLFMLVNRGTPMALETFIVQGAYFVLLSMVNSYGATTAAAYSGAAQLWGYVQMPSGAFATSMSAMAAMNIGANRWPRVEEIALKGCLVSGAVTLVAAIAMYALGDLPLELFLPAGGAALASARKINEIVLGGWIVLSVTSGLCAIVRANGAMLAPTLIYAVTMWLFRVPFATALRPLLGETAIWLSFPVGSISSALLAYAYYRWGGWRNNKPLISSARGGELADARE
jgi:putative MATE family efflux protein